MSALTIPSGPLRSPSNQRMLRSFNCGQVSLSLYITYTSPVEQRKNSKICTALYVKFSSFICTREHIVLLLIFVCVSQHLHWLNSQSLLMNMIGRSYCPIAQINTSTFSFDWLGHYMALARPLLSSIFNYIWKKKIELKKEFHLKKSISIKPQ